MAGDSRWVTSNQAYGAFWKAVPLELKVISRPPAATEVRDSLPSRECLSKLLQKHGLRERPVNGDGNCQFRAMADQLYGSEDHHMAIREQVVLQLMGCSERYQGFVPGRFEDYLRDMAQSGSWGDHVTLQAAADALGVRIHVLTDHLTDAFIEVLPREQKSNKVLRLSFWAEVHYNSLAD
ncbi:unnamed protein product [Polarella glacialis]|uniref:OTU domain-containing protein n=1 Tax=Polarella glacialis TaxID=89957 RepID=A0A813JP93_POLGL|nr:unnamed protein product [Polarella glacialis]